MGKHSIYLRLGRLWGIDGARSPRGREKVRQMQWEGWYPGLCPLSLCFDIMAIPVGAVR